MRKFFSKYGLTTGVIFALLLVGILIFYSLSFNAIINKNQDKILNILSQLARSELNVELTIEGLTAEFPFSVFLHNITMRDNDGREILKIDKAVLKADWLKLINNPESAITAVRYIQFDNPTIRTVITDKGINWTSLFQSGKESKNKISWNDANLKFVINNARLEFLDLSKSNETDSIVPYTLPLNFSGDILIVDGNLVINPKIKAYWLSSVDPRTKSNGKRKPVLQLGGFGDLSNDLRLVGDLDLTGISNLLSLLIAEYPQLSDWQFTKDTITGHFEINITNLTNPKPDINIELELDASAIELILPGFDKPLIFSNCDVRFSYPDNAIQLKASTTLADSSVDLLIQSDDLSSRNINGFINATSLPVKTLLPSRITSFAEIEGTLNVESGISGKIDNPEIAGKFWSDNLLLESKNFTMHESQFQWKNNILSIPQIYLIDNEEGFIEIRGNIKPSLSSSDLYVESGEISEDFFAQLLGYKLPFELTGSPFLNASVGILNNTWQAKVNMEIKNGSFAGIPCSKMNSSFDINEEKMSLAQFHMKPVLGGNITVTGDIVFPDTLDLDINLDEVDLKNLSFSKDKLSVGLAGTLFGTGKLVGSSADITADISLRAYNGTILGWDFERGEFNALIDSTGLRESFTRLIGTGSEIELNAEYIFDQKRPLVLWGNWENIPLSKIAFKDSARELVISGDGEFIGDADELNGIVNLNIDGDDGLGNRIFTPVNQTFTGTFLDINLTGITRFRSVTDLLDQLPALQDNFIRDGFIQNGKLEVSGGLLFESLAPESELTSLLNTLKVDILPVLTGINLELPAVKSHGGSVKQTDSKIPDSLTIPLDGLIALELTIERAADDWLLDGFATGKKFKINSENINQLNARINTRPDRNYDLSMNFSQKENGGNLSVTGSVSLDEVTGTSPLNLDVSISSYPLSSLISLAGIRSGAIFDGIIDGGGKLQGSLRDLSLQDIDLFFQSAKLFGLPVDDSRLRFSWHGTKIDNLKLELKDGKGFSAVASGSLDMNPAKISESTISLSIDNLPLENLQTGNIIPQGIKGNLTSLVMQLAYDPNSLEPKIFIDLKVDNPGYKWFQMDSITGQGFIDGATGEFKVGKFRGNQNTSSFEINGTIHPSLLKNGTTLNLSLSAENYDLAAIFEQLRIPVFCDETSLNMDIKIKGTTDNPLLYGKAEARFTNPRIENLSLSDTTSFSLEFNNNRLDINGIIKNGDASLLAKGNFDVKQFIPNQARTSQTSSDAPPVISFTNLDKPFHFKNIGLDVDVKLSGKNNSDNLQLVLLKNKAKLTGTIEIVNGSYKVSPLPISKGSTKSPVEIDLMVIVPAGFPVSSGNTMNITLEKSTLDLSGSPGQPIASGEINVLDGHLRLLDRTFTVNEAKLQFKEFLGIDNPYLKGEASTIIVSRSIRNFQGTENLVVTAKINAQLRQLNKGLTFTSNKGTLTENEVMGIVMRQDLLQDFNDEGLLSTLSQQAFTIPGAFISRFFESKGGFQLFQIGVDFENDVFVNLEYETFPNFFFDYYQAFASDPEYDIYMKYKFRNDSFIGVGTSDEGGVIIRLDYIIQLK